MVVSGRLLNPESQSRQLLLPGINLISILDIMAP